MPACAISLEYQKQTVAMESGCVRLSIEMVNSYRSHQKLGHMKCNKAHQIWHINPARSARILLPGYIVRTFTEDALET